MAQKTIQINGTDYTAYFPPAGYEVSYEKVTGQNEGLMLDGSYEEDILAIKAVVSSPLMPLTEKQQGDILSDIMSDDYATVYYFDPRKNAYRSAVMRYEIGTTKHRGTGANGNEYWTGLTVKFTDRFNME